MVIIQLGMYGGVYSSNRFGQPQNVLGKHVHDLWFEARVPMSRSLLNR